MRGILRNVSIMAVLMASACSYDTKWTPSAGMGSDVGVKDVAREAVLLVLREGGYLQQFETGEGSIWMEFSLANRDYAVDFRVDEDSGGTVIVISLPRGQEARDDSSIVELLAEGLPNTHDVLTDVESLFR